MPVKQWQGNVTFTNQILLNSNIFERIQLAFQPFRISSTDEIWSYEQGKLKQLGYDYRCCKWIMAFNADEYTAILASNWKSTADLWYIRVYNSLFEFLP